MPRFIISGHTLNDIRYASDTVLIADAESKLQYFIENTTKESKKSEALITRRHNA